MFVIRHTRSDAFLRGLARRPLPVEELSRNPQTRFQSRTLAKQMAEASQSERNLRSLVLKLNTPMILSMAIHEWLALMGFAAAFLEQRPVLFLPFGATALVLNAFIAPRSALLLENARRAFPDDIWPSGPA